MKKSAVIILMVVGFAGSVFASEACKNSNKAGLFSPTKVVTNSGTKTTTVKGIK